MKFKELKSMAAKELEEKLTELSKELIKDRAVCATGTTPKSPAKIRNNRRTIARIHHILSMNPAELKTSPPHNHNKNQTEASKRPK